MVSHYRRPTIYYPLVVEDSEGVSKLRGNFLQAYMSIACVHNLLCRPMKLNQD